MRKVILYRNIGNLNSDNQEKQAAKDAGFTVIENRAKIQPGDLVIPRYSFLPFPRELEADTADLGAKLINSYRQHNYVADLKNWVYDLGELTFPTWDRLEVLPEDCAFVLKGATNSRKFDWDTLMYAPDKKSAIQIHSKLTEDGLIGSQDIYIRKYVPLKTYMVGIKGLPITNEFRFFIYRGKVLSAGYYWSSHVDELESEPNPNEVPKDFLNKVTSIVGNKIPFYVLDVAQTAENDWVVVELNDACMSGLSQNDPNTLYSNLFKAVSYE